MCAVYLIAAGDSGMVKIGKADDPAARMAEFQCGHYQTLALLKVWPGSHAEEAALHRAFSEYKHRGEWFQFCPAMLEADPAELVQPKAVKPTPPPTALKQYLTRSGISVPDFAKLIGVTGTAAYRYLLGERIPRSHVIERIYEATNGEITANDLFAAAHNRLSSALGSVPDAASPFEQTSPPGSLGGAFSVEGAA